ncbi:hypothetical protein Tco_1548936 [Tanacetum coccineum]
MAPLTRSNSTVTDEILASLRQPIAQSMREEMEKLREEIRTTSMEATTSQLGRNQGWMYKCEQFFKVDNVPDEQKAPLISIHLFDIALMWHKYFDKLLSRVDIREDQAISFYMAGLPTNIELVVKVFKPQTLSVAYSLSKLQFETNEMSKKKYKLQILPTLRNKTATPVGQMRRRLSQKEMEEKRAKNLCLYYDQRYVPCHKCTGQVYLLEVFVDEDES